MEQDNVPALLWSSVLWVYHSPTMFVGIDSSYVSFSPAKVEGILLEDLQKSSQVQKQTNKKA